MARQNKELDIAQDIMWTAFDTASRSKRVELAKKALETCAECADAYVILAEDLITDRKERIAFLEEGVKAGHRALGPRYFKEEVGSFWLILETRPYMRVLCALALELQKDGQTEGAIEHFNQLLRLNPNDNQGIRDVLIPLLVSLKKLKEAALLLKKYKDEGNAWVEFSRALLHFKQRRNTQVARQALSQAVAGNQYVINYLLTPSFNGNLPTAGYYSPGHKDEAYLYARDWRADWQGTTGALDWIIDCLIGGYLKAEAPNVMTWRRRMIDD